MALRFCVNPYCAWLRLADLLLVPAVNGDEIVALAVHACLDTAGLQSDTPCYVTKPARLVCAQFYGCFNLCAQLCCCNAMQLVCLAIKNKTWQPIGTCNCRASKFVQHPITIACACHLGLAVLLGCFMRSVAHLRSLHVSCDCSHHCLIAVVATAFVLLSRCFIAAHMSRP